jgi:hypothetical protein
MPKLTPQDAATVDQLLDEGVRVEEIVKRIGGRTSAFTIYKIKKQRNGGEPAKERKNGKATTNGFTSLEELEKLRSYYEQRLAAINTVIRMLQEAKENEFDLPSTLK